MINMEPEQKTQDPATREMNRAKAYERIDSIIDDMYKNPQKTVEIDLISSNKNQVNTIPQEITTKLDYSSTRANIQNKARKYEINEITRYLTPQEAKTLIKNLFDQQNWFTITQENEILEYIEYP